MKYYDFKCPKNGLLGKYITLTSTSNGNRDAHYDYFTAAEVELFGNYFDSK